MLFSVRKTFGVLLVTCLAVALRAETIVLTVDFAQTNGLLRPLHGINKGPLEFGGLIDLTEEHRQLGIPFTRLHDCHWPNPDVVDIHAVFPLAGADPSRPENFQFAATDEYLARVRASGAKIVYRLGESIEHTPVKRYVHPPRDMNRWADICLGIVRHYNEGWANGFRHDIRYWEIWNEPENRPAMWSGSDEDYFRLYETTALAIRKEFPNLKIGGPSIGAPGSFKARRFQPTAFVTNFLALCRRESLPLDFFSWHCYTDDPIEFVRRAKAIRDLLDSYGFTKTESHLNEWNYLPGNTWSPGGKSARPEARQRYYEEMSGTPGAAFIAATLIELQDAPVDMANLFHGGIGVFGLFNEHGVPTKNYYGMQAFQNLLATPYRVVAHGGHAGSLAVAAGHDAAQAHASVLLSHLKGETNTIELNLRSLPSPGPIAYDVMVVERGRNPTSIQHGRLQPTNNARLSFDLAGPAVAIIRVSFR